MAITNKWEVNKCVGETADGYVKNVIYRVTAEDGTYRMRATGNVDLPKPETLVPFADLTHDQVIGWVKSKLDADNEGTVASIEAALTANINEQKAPTVAEGNPW